MLCSNCGREVPEGLFCTVCGAHQAAEDQPGGGGVRLHHFAAHPGEHVLSPSVFTTLFPHLGRHKVHEFRWTFLVGAAAIVILFLFGFVTAALLGAIFLLPALYLLYLVEAEVYHDEPASVLGLTLGGGFVLGIVLTLITNWLIDTTGGQHVSVLVGRSGLFTGGIVVASVIVPIIQEALKPIPALALQGRLKQRQTVDGLVFGVAAGLAFSAGSILVRYWNPLSTLPVNVSPADWLSQLITLGVLSMLLQGAATGAIVAALWRLGRGRLGGREIGGIGAAVVAHIAFDLGSALLAGAGFGSLVVLFWQAGTVAALLLYVRFLLHHALLDEAGELGFRQTVCSNCHRQVAAAGFCPACGKALTAAPNALRQVAAPATDAGPSPTEAS